MDKSNEVLNEIISSQNSYISSKHKVPKGIRFISILGYITTALLIISGTLLLSLGILISIGLSSAASSNLLSQFSGTLFNVIKDFSIVIGIILIVLSIMAFILSLFLWKGRNWARTIVIIISGIITTSMLYLMITGGYGNFFYLIIFVFNIIVFLYLLLSKRVKEAFSPALP